MNVRSWSSGCSGRWMSLEVVKVMEVLEDGC